MVTAPLQHAGVHDSRLASRAPAAMNGKALRAGDDGSRRSDRFKSLLPPKRNDIWWDRHRTSRF
jgi:hypothetical protein